MAHTMTYHRYRVDQFVPRRDRLDIRVGNQRFASDTLTIALPELEGHLRFRDLAPWQGSLLRPGIMGWYTFVPLMQCYHGLVSADHRIEGALRIRGEQVDMTGGKGYTEKDWGSSFPATWIWTQCNHYEGHEHLSVMASVAHIPWLRSYFIGFLALVWHGQTMKVFTTYTGAEMRARIEDDTVYLDFRDRNSQLSLVARQAPGVELRAPVKGAMTGKVNESLQAIHEISYRSPQAGHLESRGSVAGLEVAGDSDILLTDQWRR